MVSKTGRDDRCTGEHVCQNSEGSGRRSGRGLKQAAVPLAVGVFPGRLGKLGGASICMFSTVGAIILGRGIEGIVVVCLVGVGWLR